MNDNDALDILREVAQPLREALANCTDHDQSVIAGTVLVDDTGRSIRVSDLIKILDHIYDDESKLSLPCFDCGDLTGRCTCFEQRQFIADGGWYD